MSLLMKIVCSPSPMIVGAALAIALALAQVAVDLFGHMSDPVISDAFKVVIGITASLIGARQIAVNNRPMDGGTK